MIQLRIEHYVGSEEENIKKIKTFVRGMVCKSECKVTEDEEECDLIFHLCHKWKDGLISRSDLITALTSIITESDYSRIDEIERAIPFLVSVSPIDKELEGCLEEIIVTHCIKLDDIALEVRIDKMRIDTLVILEHFFKEKARTLLDHFRKNEQRIIYRILYHYPFKVYSSFKEYFKGTTLERVFSKELKWGTKLKYLKKAFE